MKIPNKPVDCDGVELSLGDVVAFALPSTHRFTMGVIVKFNELTVKIRVQKSVKNYYTKETVIHDVFYNRHYHSLAKMHNATQEKRLALVY